MAITTIDLTVPRRDRNGRTYFCVFFTSADLSGCEVIKSSANGQIYLESVTVWTASAITFTIGYGETAGAVESALFGPIDGSAVVSPPRLDKDFKRELQLPVDKDLTIDASAAGTIYGIVEGFTVG